MSDRLKRIPAYVRYGVYGLFFGFAMSRMGFGDYAEIREMFTFRDLRLFMTFCTGVAIAMAGFAVLARGHLLPQRRFHPGTVIGSLLFGAGWALTGACPSIIWVQVGEGAGYGLVTLVGVGLGSMAYPLAHRRWFGWQADACGV